MQQCKIAHLHVNIKLVIHNIRCFTVILNLKNSTNQKTLNIIYSIASVEELFVREMSERRHLFKLWGIFWVSSSWHFGLVAISECILIYSFHDLHFPCTYIYKMCYDITFNIYCLPSNSLFQNHISFFFSFLNSVNTVTHSLQRHSQCAIFQRLLKSLIMLNGIIPGQKALGSVWYEADCQALLSTL